jgi:pyruvate dehydrogenase E2 component (dihydrolipoamide acetyltransferase)
MAISVVMPALEMAQETGKLVAWLKKEGDRVAKGDLLLEIETDKAVVEVEALADGILAGVTGKVGADIPVGQVIAWIVRPGETAPAVSAPEKHVTVEDTEGAQPAVRAPEQQPVAGRISPKARRMAKEAGIDIGAVRGSGPGGEILAADVRTLMDAAADQAAPGAPVKQSVTQQEALSSIGRLMAERTTWSWTTVPHFFLQRDVDATGLNVARAAYAAAIEQTHGVRLTHTDLLIALVARTLAMHPRINASWIDDGIRLNAEVNVAIAMAVDDGAVAAVIRNAHTIPLGEIARQRRDLTERARAGRLRLADLSGGTFTISNLGMFHIDSFSAIITPPQAAILAVGQIAERVVPIDGGIGVRPMLSLTLSSDHRVIDGAKGAIFLRDLGEAIHDPEKWLA